MDKVVHDRLALTSLFREELSCFLSLPLAFLKGFLSFHPLVLLVDTLLLFHLPLRLSLGVPQTLGAFLVLLLFV